LVQVNVLLIILIYIIAHIPFSLVGFLNEKFRHSAEMYKYVSLKQFFARNLLISALCIIIPIGVYAGASYGSDNMQGKLIKQINEQLANVQNKKIVINGEISSTEFNDTDYSYMQNQIVEELGNNAVYKLLTLDDAQTDANGEKYISATYGGYGENDNDIICFIFRKYLTSSNYHEIGDMELYMTWISNSLTKESI